MIDGTTLYYQREVKYAWAAGLFEGEGSFSFDKRQEHGVEMRLEMTDEDVVDRFKSTVGFGQCFRRKGRSTRHKDTYTWRLRSAREVEFVIGILLPYLGERRRDKASKALQRLAQNKGAYAKRTTV